MNHLYFLISYFLKYYYLPQYLILPYINIVALRMYFTEFMPINITPYITTAAEPLPFDPTNPGDDIHFLCHVMAAGMFPSVGVIDARCYGSASGLSKLQIWQLFHLDRSATASPYYITATLPHCNTSTLQYHHTPKPPYCHTSHHSLVLSHLNIPPHHHPAIVTPRHTTTLP